MAEHFDYKKHSYRRIIFILLGLLICAVSFMTDVIVGPASLTLRDVWLAVMQSPEVSKNADVIIWSIRLPTAVMALLVGASLGIAGAGMQTILDNPLSSPYTLGISAGAVMAAVDRFVFRFRGKGTHAAHPEAGVDPIPLAAAFVQSVQTVVARNLNPFSAGLVSVTHIEAGNTWNVISEEALVEGTTRSMNAQERAHIRARVCALAEQLAAAYGATVETDWYDGPPATLNDGFWAAYAEEKAKERNLTVVPAPKSLGGEDFAFYQEKVPGMFVLVGTGLSPALHNPNFRVDLSALAPTAHYLAELVCGAFKKVKER